MRDIFDKYSDKMKNSSKQIDRQTLKILEPLDRLNPILLDELAAKSIIEEVSAGRIICRHGESDSRQIYLLNGQVEVVTPGQSKINVIKAKSAHKTPLSHGTPHSVTLKAKTDSTLLYIDADLLELLMSDEPQLTAAYEVTEITADDDSDDWMLTFLQSPAFLQLPTENIQKLLTHMDEVQVKKDQVIISQGNKDDNYYIIKSGSCNVHRKPYKGSASVLLATLPTGNGFGEEALISNGARNATITMRENGTLMRLKKDDFLTLLINPLISYFDFSETQDKINQGSLIIDVRSEQQSKDKPVPNSVNIPLSMLRMKLDSLNAEREYLLLCDDGSQSAAAAFLMIQGGMQCSVLEGGINSANTNKVAAKKAGSPVKVESASTIKANEQAAVAKQQTTQLAEQQKQIKAAREKAEQDILKHKKELAASRARIAQKNQKVSSTQQESNVKMQRAEQMVQQSTAEASKVRQQAVKEAELIKQQAREAEQLRAHQVQKQTDAKTVQLRKQAEKDAAIIKQRALEDAERLKSEKAAQDLAKAETVRKSIELQQQETNKAMRQAEEIMKQSAANAEKARQQAENEAVRIKQRAIEEAEYLKAEVEAARQKMQQDAARIKAEEQSIKKSALKIKSEADEIRRSALNDAQQVRLEIQETRALLNKKLQQTQEEEKRKHDAILAQAKKKADKLSATKTLQASKEAEQIRQKAKQDAARLHNELEQTRKQIEADATRVINQLKQESKRAAPVQQKVHVIEEEIVVELVDDDVNYTSVNIPGMSAAAPINDAVAQRKAETIKSKLNKQAADVRVHKSKDKTILESEEDLFIFKEPTKTANTASSVADIPAVTKAPTVSHRTQAESSLTQIATNEAQKSVVIFPQQEQESANRNNPFLDQDNSETPTRSHTQTQQFNRQAYLKQHQSSKSNTLAIAASFMMIIAGAIFTLHATNTLKVQSIAALFNSGNDTVQTTAIAKVNKPIRKKILRADTKLNIKKKVDNKVDNIMNGWKNILSDSKDPKNNR